MFTDLFRIVSEYGLSVPPEIAAVFRALATMEGTLTRLAPGFNIVAEAQRFAADCLAEQLRPSSLRKAATSGIIAVLMLGIQGGPHLTSSITLYQFLGYCFLVVGAILALRVLVAVLRPDTT